MKFLRSMVGYMVAGTIVMSVWNELGSFGIFGGTWQLELLLAQCGL